MAVGSPGLALAVLVSTIKEPIRGQNDGLDPTPTIDRPLYEVFTVLAGMAPALIGVGSLVAPAVRKALL